MTNLKFENIWALLNKYNFEIDPSLIQDLKCPICRKIIKNSRQSLCGCRYCYECIKTYLSEEDKICPGPTKDCRECVLNLERDIELDHVANMRVSRLVLKCPESSCQFTDELRNMEKHISSHQLNCPYLEIGCSSLGTNSLNIHDHLRENEMAHSTLIIDSIQNLRNELTFVKEESQKNSGANDEVRCNMEKIKSSDFNQSDMSDPLKDSADYKVENMKLHHDLGNLNNELEMMKKNYKEKEAAVTKLQQKLNKVELENKKALNEMKNDFQNLRNRLANIEKSRSQSEFPKNPPKPKERPKPMSPPRATGDTPSDISATFLWTINQFSEKRTTAEGTADSFIMSKPFFSHENGYRLCLIAFPNGCVATNNKHLGVGFHIMKGPNDGQLPWPMMRTVTIGLVDQQSKVANICIKYHYDTSDDNEKAVFHRPTTEMSEARKSTKFVHLNVLMGNSKLCRNDSVILSCVVE